MTPEMPAQVDNQGGAMAMNQMAAQNNPNTQPISTL